MSTVTDRDDMSTQSSSGTQYVASGNVRTGLYVSLQLITDPNLSAQAVRLACYLIHFKGGDLVEVCAELSMTPDELLQAFRDLEAEEWLTLEGSPEESREFYGFTLSSAGSYGWDE